MAVSPDFLNPFESPREQDASTSAVPASNPSTRQRGRLSPPSSVWVVAAAFVITAGIVRWRTISGDHAVVNILTLVCGLLAGLTVGIWFLFFSGYRRRFRFGTLCGMMAAVVAFFAILRLEHVSGELIPNFRPRWTKKVDETLERPVATSNQGQVDLATITSDDFPQFLGPQRNARVDHVQLARDWTAQPPRQLWKQPIGAGWSGFAAVNGFAVTIEQRGPEELVTCYEIGTGKLMWSYATATRHETVLGGVGPRGTPTIHDGKVYAQGATGEFLCLDGATGKRIWRVNLLESYEVPAGTDENGVAWGRSGSPLVVDDLAVIPAGGPAKGPWVSLAAFDRETGKLIWEAGHQQVSYSSPLVTTLAGLRQIVCVHEKSVAGHDLKTGKQLWSFDWPGNSTADANVAQPVQVSENELLLTKGYGRGAMLVRISASSPATLSASQVWQDRTLLKTKFTNVVLYQGHIYGLSDGILECVAAATGKRQWKQGRYGQGQILGVGDAILVQAESGEVAMVAASPAGYQELTRFQALEGKTWNNLCLFGKRLLVRNAEEAACYELP